MIIQLNSATAENTGAARRSLEELARSWGHEITESPRRGDAGSPGQPR